MLKKILTNIRNTLDKLDETGKVVPTKYIRSQIENDMKELEHYLDSDKGFIDYYSPKAKEQLDYQKKLFEKYIELLTRLQAGLIFVTKKKQEEENIATLNQPKDADEARKAVDEIVIRIKRIASFTKELASIKEKLQADKEAPKKKKLLNAGERSNLENRKIELEAEINSFNEETSKIKGYAIVDEGTVKLQRSLTRHEGVTAQIPEGMLDVKRALSTLREVKLIERKIESKQKKLKELSDDHSGRAGVLKEIAELENKKSSLKFSRSAEVDNKIKAMLEDLRALMTSSIKGYQDLYKAGGEFNAMLHKTTAFYWETLTLYRETLSAVNRYVSEATDLTEEGRLVAKCITTAFEKVPQKDEIDHALDIVRLVDQDLANREKYEERYHKKAHMSFYRAPGAKFIQSLLDNNGICCMLPYNSSCYALDHPAHTDLAGALGNCYGETQMFLKRVNGNDPTVNNICPETELINFQLDQSRSVVAPKGESKKIGKFVASAEEGKDKARWDTIKDFLVKEVDSEKHGDLCMLRLSGGKVEGHGKDVGHMIGLIKMKNPSPYKYIVYDYGYGAMGFSTDEQLQKFCEMIFEGDFPYCDFPKCVLEKVGEVSDACQQFFNGPHGVKPLDKPDLTKGCERSYWDKQHLVLLAKYCSTTGEQDGLKLVLEKMNLLSNVGDKDAVFEAIFENNTLNQNEDFLLAAMQHNLDYLQNMGSELVAKVIRKGQFSEAELERILDKRPHNEEIVLATYVVSNSKLKILKTSDQQVVEGLIRKGKVSLEDALQAFPEKYKPVKEIEQRLKELVVTIKKQKQIVLTVEQRIQEMTALSERYEQLDERFKLDDLASGIDKAARNICEKLIDDVKILGVGEKGLRSKASLSKISGKALIDAMKDLSTKLAAAHQVLKETEREREVCRTLVGELQVLLKSQPNASKLNKANSSLFAHVETAKGEALKDVKAKLEEKKNEITVLLAEQDKLRQAAEARVAEEELEAMQQKDRCHQLIGEIQVLSGDLQAHGAFELSAELLDSIETSKESLVDVISELESTKAELTVLRADIDQQKANIESRLDSLTPLADRATPALQKTRIQLLFDIQKRHEALKEIVNAPELAARIQEKIADVLCSHAPSAISRTDAPILLKLLAEKNGYLEKYADILASGHRISLGYLILADKKYGAPVVENAMSLVAAGHKNSVLNYLLLVDMKKELSSLGERENAERYLEGLLEEGTDKEMMAMKGRCLSLIDFIRQQAWGPKDKETHVYCDEMKKEIDGFDKRNGMTATEGTVALIAAMEQLKNIHEAVTSPEMMAVREQVERFEKNAKNFFSSGNQKKADRIKEAVCHVPLENRAHVFSGQGEASNQVRIALAMRRHSLINPVINNRVDPQRAAPSYHQVADVARALTRSSKDALSAVKKAGDDSELQEQTKPSGQS